jgi:hypothetical protein
VLYTLDRAATIARMQAEVDKLAEPERARSREALQAFEAVEGALELHPSGQALLRVSAVGRSNEARGLWTRQGPDAIVVEANGRTRCTRDGFVLTCSDGDPARPDKPKLVMVFVAPNKTQPRSLNR